MPRRDDIASAASAAYYPHSRLSFSNGAQMPRMPAYFDYDTRHALLYPAAPTQFDFFASLSLPGLSLIS